MPGGPGRARVRTLLPMMRTALWSILMVVVLNGFPDRGEHGPLLAGAGIVGVAIGFGSQTLVQDLITGIFLLLENAMEVGDVVTVGGLTGMVENLSIRSIRLRAADGTVHIVPFSAVTTVTNQNRGLGNAAVRGLRRDARGHRPGVRDAQGDRPACARTPISRSASWRTSALGRRQGGRRVGDDRRASGLHRFRALERAARVQPADEAAVRGAGHPALQPGGAHGRSAADHGGGDIMKPLVAELVTEGFAFVRGAEMRGLFGPMADWPAFAASWDDLGVDTYMADGGRYRKRRHAAFGARAGEPIDRKPHQPHYQSRDYNPLNGGIARWFDPVLPEIAAGASMTAILAMCRALFERLAPTRDWHIEAHQFRIEAWSGGQVSRPRRVCTATAWTTCWCCWSGAATSRAGSRRSTARMGGTSAASRWRSRAMRRGWTTSGSCTA